MTTNDEEQDPAAISAGHAVLGAAGEAVAFFAGAPIAGAADAATGLGDVVADREARLEDAITGHHAPEGPARSGRPWVMVLLVVVVIAALVWALKG